MSANKRKAPVAPSDDPPARQNATRQVQMPARLGEGRVTITVIHPSETTFAFAVPHIAKSLGFTPTALRSRLARMGVETKPAQAGWGVNRVPNYMCGKDLHQLASSVKESEGPGSLLFQRCEWILQVLLEGRPEAALGGWDSFEDQAADAPTPAITRTLPWLINGHLPSTDPAGTLSLSELLERQGEQRRDLSARLAQPPYKCVAQPVENGGLFAAVADQLRVARLAFSISEIELRHALAEYLSQTPAVAAVRGGEVVFSNYLPRGVKLEEYCEKLREGYSPSDFFSIAVIAEKYQVRVRVVSSCAREMLFAPISVTNRDDLPKLTLGLCPPQQWFSTLRMEHNYTPHKTFLEDVRQSIGEFAAQFHELLRTENVPGLETLATMLAEFRQENHVPSRAVLVGDNNTGKSFFLNTMLALGSIESELYKTRDWQEGWQFSARNGNVRRHQPSLDEEKLLRSGLTPNESDVVLAEYFKTGTIPKGFAPFLLPCSAGSKITTTVVVHLRYGKRFELSAQYASQQKVRDIAFQYAQLRASNTEPKPADTARWRLLTNNQDVTKVKHPSDIRLNAHLVASNLLGTTQVYAGNGNSFDIDRAYVRNRLYALMGRSITGLRSTEEELKCEVEAAVLERLIVYVPCTLLRSMELIDAPGTNDIDYLRDHILEREVSEADCLVLFMNAREIGANASIYNLLQPPEEGEVRSQGTAASCSEWLRHKLLRNPSKYSMLVLHYLERDHEVRPTLASLCSASERENFLNMKKTCVEETRRKLLALFKEKYNVQDPQARLQGSMVVLGMAPVLFTSMQLNRDEALDYIVQHGIEWSAQDIEDDCSGWELLGSWEKHAYRSMDADIQNLKKEVAKVLREFEPVTSSSTPLGQRKVLRAALETVRGRRQLSKEMGEWRDSFAQLLAQLKGELQNYRTKLLSCMNSVTAAAQENMATDLAFLKKHPHVLNPELPSYRHYRLQSRLFSETVVPELWPELSKHLEEFALSLVKPHVRLIVTQLQKRVPINSDSDIWFSLINELEEAIMEKMRSMLLDDDKNAQERAKLEATQQAIRNVQASDPDDVAETFCSPENVKQAVKLFFTSYFDILREHFELSAMKVQRVLYENNSSRVFTYLPPRATSTIILRLNGDEGDKRQSDGHASPRDDTRAALTDCVTRLDSLRDLLSGAPTDIGRSIAAFLPLQQIARRARAAGQSHGKLQKRALDLKPTNRGQVTQCTDDANGILLCRKELLGNFDAELDVMEIVLRPLDRKIVELSLGDLAPPDSLFLAVLSQFYEFDDLELQVKRNEIRCLRSFCVSYLKQRFAAPSMLPRFKDLVDEAPESVSPWKLLNTYLEKLLPSRGEACFGDALTLFSLATCFKMPILVWLPNGKVLQIPPHVTKEAQNRGAIELALLRSTVHDGVQGLIFGVIRSMGTPSRPRPLPVPVVEAPVQSAPTIRQSVALLLDTNVWLHSERMPSGAQYHKYHDLLRFLMTNVTDLTLLIPLAVWKEVHHKKNYGDPPALRIAASKTLDLWSECSNSKKYGPNRVVFQIPLDEPEAVRGLTNDERIVEAACANERRVIILSEDKDFFGPIVLTKKAEFGTKICTWRASDVEAFRSSLPGNAWTIYTGERLWYNLMRSHPPPNIVDPKTAFAASPMIVDSQGSQSEHAQSWSHFDDPWDAFEHDLQRLYGVNRLVDHGGHPHCFFNCIRAKLREAGVIVSVPSVAELRNLLADELKLMYPGGIPEAEWKAVQAAAQGAQAGLDLRDWRSYLNQLRRDLYGGDVEIGAVQHWMKRVHNRKVNICIFTPDRNDVQYMGNYDIANPPWRLARLGSHYRTVVIEH